MYESKSAPRIFVTLAERLSKEEVEDVRSPLSATRLAMSYCKGL